MAGTITHKWDGTVLTVTSDSGTSSADLKGAKGDDGARGAVGACPTLSVNGRIGEVVLNADDVGAVSKTGDTMTGGLTATDLAVSSAHIYPSTTLKTATDNRAVSYGAAIAENTMYGQVVYNDGKGNNEYYMFPDRTSEETGNAWHSILTSKNTITVAQGGTGATTASGACDSIGAVKKSGDTMTGDLHLVGKNVYANQFATNSTTDNPQFALIYGGNDSTTLQMNNPDWSSDNWLRLYKDSTVLGKPLAIGSGGTGQTTLSGFQSQAMYAQYMHTPTENVLTLPNGYYHIEGVVSKETNGFPYDSTDTRAEVTVFGNRNGENGYYCVCVIEMWGGTIYINRRTWSSWSGWTKITPTAV